MKAKEKKVLKKELNERFLQAVSIILQKNKERKIKPDTEREVSRVLGMHYTTISQVRLGKRSVTLSQIYKLGQYFNLDFNFFFRTDVRLRYDLYNDSQGALRFNQLPGLEQNLSLVYRMAETAQTHVDAVGHSLLMLEDQIKLLEPGLKENPELLAEFKEIQENLNRKFKSFRSFGDKKDS